MLEVVPSQEELIQALSPERDYGEFTYEQIVEGVRSGAILIKPGQHLPRIVDAQTFKTMKGTGIPPGAGVGPQHRALHRFRELAINDVDWALENLKKGMERGDPRYDKIYWEYMIGRAGEAKESGMSDVLKMLIERLDKPEKRHIDIE